ncbi:MAG: hypothetical protein R3F59_26235 [Myxococcota bacterium]
MWVGTAFAVGRADQEYRAPTSRPRRRSTSPARSGIEVHEFDNLDFRKLDESSDQAILDSDDRGGFAFTGASLALAYTVDPQVRVFFEAGHRGLWGDDQIGSVNSFGGFLYIPSMYAELWTSPDPGKGARFQIGRQFFQIGGLGGARDYVLADVLDMVRVDVALGDVGRLAHPAEPVLGVGNLAEVNFVSLLGQQYAETFDFRGDTLTRRFGGVLALDTLPIPVDATAYLFYTDVGARGTGSDISYDGALGNFSDNDWVLNAGVRASASLADGLVRPYAHVDLSRGIDRKEVIVEDVDCNGLAYGLGVRIDGDSMLEQGLPGISAEVSFFDAFGPAYAKNGQQYSHGYVGMKGQQAGGQLLNRFMGWHPTAYLGRNGVSDHPQNMERIAGTRVIHADVGFELPLGFEGGIGWWLMQDNGITFLAFSDLDNINPPFGYSRAEYSAQRRLGQTLANEIDGELGWEFGEHVDIYAGAATVLPGSFYATTIDRVAGTALGSNAPVNAWAVYAGSQVVF